SDYLIADEVWQAWHAEGVSWPTFTVSEWADAKRFLPQSSATRGGRWRTDANPCLRGIMNVVHEPNVLKIAVKKAAQVGVSEVLHNIVGYFIAHDACPMLFVHPAARDAEEWSKD